jgi:hypothetical protein
MNCILIHLGGEIPSHFWIALGQAMKKSNKVYAIVPDNQTDDPRLSGVKVSPQSRYSSHKIVTEKANSWIGETYGSFWGHALDRLFYLEALIKDQNLLNVIHIENDVLIYPQLSEIEPALSKAYVNRIAINSVGEKYASAAFIFIPNCEVLSFMNQKLVDLLAKGKEYLMERIGESMVNEMLLLQIVAIENPEFVGFLPSLPWHEHAKEIGYLFDSASYGQYLYGTGANNPGWTGDHHHVGRAINNRKIDVYMPMSVDTFPTVEAKADGTFFRLANLHMHCKQLEQAL